MTPIESPLFLIGQRLASLHLCITNNKDGNPQEIKSLAKSFTDIIVRMHLSNELRPGEQPPSTNQGRQGRQQGGGRQQQQQQRNMAGGESYDDPKWKSHYEIGYWWNLFSKLTDPQLMVYVISCYQKIFAGIKTDLTCDAYNPHVNIWPPSVSCKHLLFFISYHMN